MTVKEIETRSGMTRANIRFYEAEGLLSPARSGNGYRDYTKTDLEELKRIRLLRTLGLSLAEIRALQTGEETLGPLLECQIAQLDRESADLRRARTVCGEMCADGAEYHTLDAQRYLDDYDRPQAIAAPSPAVRPSPLAEDVLPPVRSPWRRLFARLLDLGLYGVVWDGFLVLVCNVDVSSLGPLPALMNSFPPVVLMLLVEPLLLALIGTTAGKWIVGLRVTDLSGERLRYPEALLRTWLAVRQGLGLNIPIYALIRAWSSYRACRNGETLAWEEDTALQLRDERAWRGAALAVAFVVLVGLSALTLMEGGMPRHRGDLTAAQFIDNYERLAAYHGVGYDARLTEDGTWEKIDGETGFAGGMYDQAPLPDFVLTETDGVVTGVSFSYETDSDQETILGYQNEMYLSVLALVCAQPGFGAFSEAREELLELIRSSPYESFDYAANGVAVSCRMDYSGYHEIGDGALIPAALVESASDGQAGEQTHYAFSFSITIDPDA